MDEPRDVLERERASFRSSLPAPTSRYAFDLTKEIDAYAVDCYRILSACLDQALEDENKGLIDDPELSNWRDSLYASTQSVKEGLVGLLRQLTELELQYWVWQISIDLSPSVKLAPWPAPRFITRPLASQIDLPKNLLPRLPDEAKRIWKTMSRSPVRVLDIATPNMREILSWTIIVHEAAHQIPGLRSFVKNLDEKARAGLSHRKLLEVAADLLAAYYLGPSFCLALARFADLIRPMSGAIHPVMRTRLVYLTTFLERELAKANARTSSGAIERKIIQEVLADLKGRIKKWKTEDEEEPQKLLAIPNASLFVEIEDFAKKCIRTNWLTQLRADLGKEPFRDWSPQTTSSEIQKLATKRVMLAVHPSTNFNLALLLPKEMIDQEPVADAIRTSIRKYMIAQEFTKQLQITKAVRAQALEAQAPRAS